MALATGLTATLVLSMMSRAVARRDQEDPEVTYCNSLTELAASIESLASMSASSTVDELKAGVEQVKEGAFAQMEAVASARDAVGTLPNCALVLGEQAVASPAP